MINLLLKARLIRIHNIPGENYKQKLHNYVLVIASIKQGVALLRSAIQSIEVA